MPRSRLNEPASRCGRKTDAVSLRRRSRGRDVVSRTSAADCKCDESRGNTKV